MNALAITDFDEFFHELHEHDPYDWQRRLAGKAVAGTWPDIIDLPTGSGKTACLDVAVFALACQAALPVEKRTAPRRIFFCVNRRVIVDEAHQRGVQLAKAIWQAERTASNSKQTLQRVAAALRTISGINDSETPPLDVLELRGGIYRDNRWARSATQPTIICTTIDQLGSRLLFRGYGVSSEAAPIQAALIAYDSLVLLDEAHISRPFLQSLDWIEKYLNPEKWAEQSVGVRRMKVVPMTATPPEVTSTNDVIHLEDKDRRNEGLNNRLTCNKPTVLKSVKSLVESVVSDATQHAQGAPAAIGIIVNRVATAKEIYSKLREEHPEAVVELVIGSMRPVDRDRQADRLRELVGPDRPKVTTQSSFVVATQCLEVGADYDFDVLITESSSLDALRQRFGRLNRAGRPIESKGIILIAQYAIRPRNPDPIYDDALPATWNWLWEHAEVTSVETEPSVPEEGQPNKRKRKSPATPIEVRSVDFGIDGFNKLLEEHGEDGRTPEELLSPSSKLDAPVMMPAYIDLWCQTSPQPVPDPDVSLFIHGLQEGARDVQVCWRADLVDDGMMTTEQWCDVVSLLPPTAAECMSVPIGRFRRWLLASADVLGDQSDLLIVDRQEEEQEKDRLRTLSVLWKGAKDSEVLTSANDLYPGCTIVLPISAKGWDELGHVPEPALSAEEVAAEGNGAQSDASPNHPTATDDHFHFDVAQAAFLQAKDRAALRVHPALIAPCSKSKVIDEILARIVDPDSLLPISELRSLLKDMAGELQSAGDATTLTLDPQWLRDLADPRNGLQRELYPDGRGLVITTRRRLNRATDWYLPSLDDGDDQLSRILRNTPIFLSDHSAHVRDETAATLERLPLSDLKDVYEIATVRHDWGKADERFQAMLRRTDRSDAWLYAGVTARLLAKSDSMPQSRAERAAARMRAELPAGFRHEMLSVQLAEKSDTLPDDPVQQELILHLIAAHHGYARPFAPVVLNDSPPDVTVNEVSLNAAERLEIPPHRLDSGIADRFWTLTKRYGWWGLAYLEAILRLADQQASANEDEGKYQDQTHETETGDLETIEVSQ